MVTEQPPPADAPAVEADPKGIIAARFLQSLLDEVVIDAAIDAHRLVKKARGRCAVCGNRCRSHTATAAHTHIEVVLSGEGSNEAEGSQRQSLNGTGPAPSPGTKTPSSGTPVGSASGIATASTSTSTAGKPDYYSHNPLYECLVCSRQVSSNRYAPHLAKCLGIGGKGARKGAARNAKAGDKGRLNSVAASERQSASGTTTPSVLSDAEDVDEASRRRKKLADSLGLNGNGKRALSPASGLGAKLGKKMKTNTPPPSGNKAEGDTTAMARSKSATFAPSSLGAAPLQGSPLNPHKYTKALAVDSSGADGRAGSPASSRGISPSPTPGRGGRGRGRGRGRGTTKSDRGRASSGRGAAVGVGKPSLSLTRRGTASPSLDGDAEMDDLDAEGEGEGEGEGDADPPASDAEAGAGGDADETGSEFGSVSDDDEGSSGSGSGSGSNSGSDDDDDNDNDNDNDGDNDNDNDNDGDNDNDNDNDGDNDGDGYPPSSSPDIPLPSLPKRPPPNPYATQNTGGLERSKGSDGEYIDVDSASEPSEHEVDF